MSVRITSICTLGLMFSFSTVALAQAQTVASGGQARPALSRDLTMTNPTTIDSPSAARTGDARTQTVANPERTALADSEAIRPFRVAIPEEKIVDLRRRLLLGF